MMHPVHQYATDVVYGDLRAKVCEAEYLACKRHLDDLARQNAPGFPYVFDETRADRLYLWFTKCKHVRGPFSGQPIELLDWQKFDLGCFYGWVEAESGARRFALSLELRARANVKSTEKSAEALFFMNGDCVYPPDHPELARFERMPEVECAAVDREQAKRVYGDAREMALSSPEIAKRMKIRQAVMSHKTRGGHIRPLSRETKNKDSGAPCGVIIDEYHAHPSSEIVDVLKSGFGKRMQSAMRIISTAGKDAENSPCKKEYDLARRILRGDVVDERYFVMIRELDADDDPHDETAWVKPNPILREDTAYSRNLYKEIKSEHDLAYGSGDAAKITNWLIRRVNRWQVGGENRYMTSDAMTRWKQGAVSREAFRELVKGIPAHVGVDLSKTIDLTASAEVFPLGDGRFAVRAHGYMPEEGITRHEHTDRVEYAHWVREGWVTATPGSVTDYHYILSDLQDKELEDGWSLTEFCYDPYGATHFAQEVAQEYGEEKVVEIRQGVPTLSEPTKLFRALVMQGKIVHDDSPLLTWALSNAVEAPDHNENIKLSKRHKDDSQRIGPIAAVINAFVRASLVVEDVNAYILGGGWGV